MTCLIHSPAFNCVKMVRVAGVGDARLEVRLRLLEVRLLLVAERRGFRAGRLVVIHGLLQVRDLQVSGCDMSLLIFYLNSSITVT